MSARRFEGQVIIVTGGSSGLGEADCKLFAAEGAEVVVADIDARNGERVCAEIGGAATFASLNVADEDAWRLLVADVMSRHGRLDVLVNNAGISEINTPETITAADLRRSWEVSVLGTVLGCKHALGAIRQNRQGGAIVNMSSITAIRGEPYVAAYSAAKGGITAYTRSLAVYCAQAGLPIRVNAVLPAAIDTPMVRGFVEKFEGLDLPVLGKREEGGVPAALGRPDDVAALVAFLASRDARFISGQSIAIDNTASVTLGNVPNFQ